MGKHQIKPTIPRNSRCPGPAPAPPPQSRGPTSGAGGGGVTAPQTLILQERIQGILAFPQLVGIAPPVIQLRLRAGGKGRVVVGEAGRVGAVAQLLRGRCWGVVRSEPPCPPPTNRRGLRLNTLMSCMSASFTPLPHIPHTPLRPLPALTPPNPGLLRLDPLLSCMSASIPQPPPPEAPKPDQLRQNILMSCMSASYPYPKPQTQVG